jgi:phosphoribosylanthranilate isomerase
LPPFVTVTGLFVNVTEQELMEVVRQVPLQLLQFHGDETPPSALRWRPQQVCRLSKLFASDLTQGPDDLLECERSYRSASPLFNGLLLDTFRRKLRW